MSISWIAAVALSAWAQTSPAAPPAPDDITDWTLEAPPAKPPTPGQPTVTNAEGSFSQSETIRFGDQMRHNVLDQICRGVDIAPAYGYSLAGVGGVTGRIDRSIQVLPDQRLALVEQAGLALDLGRALLSAQESVVGVGLSISGHIDGTSMVVRPLPTKNSCKELGTLVKVWKQKTVLPLKAERIQEMELGELWKVPMTLSVGPVLSASDPLNPYVGASLSFGTGQTGTALVTLYRMAQDKVRLRVRIDHVRVHNEGGQVVEIFPAIELLHPAGGLVLGALERLLDREISRQVVSFMGAMVGGYGSQSEGQQLLMEFVLDPNNEKDMQTLAKVLQGDFKTGVMMALKMVTLQATPENARADFEKEEQKMEKILGRPANDPALDIYHGNIKRFAFILPFFVNHSRAKTTGDDQIVRLTPEGGQFRLYRAEKTKDTGNFNIPIKGALVKRNELRSAQAFTFEPKDGAPTPAQAVYIQQKGFLREDAGSVREMVGEINGIMALAGARGGSSNPRMNVPIDPLLPPPPPAEYDPGTSEFRPANVPTYHDGSVQWTLVFTAKGVEQIMAAADEVIVKSFFNTLDASDRILTDWLMSLPQWWSADGKPSYDWHDFWKKFGAAEDYQQLRSRLDSLCKTAAAIVSDVDQVRRAPTQAARAQAMVDLMAGRGESELEYQDILKVLVQLVDPINLTSDLNVNVAKGIKGQPDVHSHFVLKKDRPLNPELERAGREKNRFSTPNKLVD